MNVSDKVDFSTEGICRTWARVTIASSPLRSTVHRRTVPTPTISALLFAVLA